MATQALVAAFAKAALDALSLELPPAIAARAGRLQLPGAATFADGVLGCPTVELLDATVDVDLGSLPRGRGLARRPAAREALRLLDALGGQLDVDAIVGVAAHPAIPKVTNALRIPIEAGTLDFQALERGFHRLVDAVLNLRVRDARLELEKDIPLVPWDESTLVAWDLDADDQALAALGRVRLRRLLDAKVLDARLKGAPGTSEGEGCHGFGSLALEGLDLRLSTTAAVELRLPGGGVARLGSPGEPGLDELRVRGAVRCARDGPPPSTSLTLGARAITGALRGVRAAGVLVDATRFAVEEPSGAVAFEGLTPVRLTLRTPRIKLEGVTVARG